MSLAGSKLAGGNPANERVENDFYATNPKAVTMLLDRLKEDNVLYETYNIGHYFSNDFLEPCVGNGNIANEVNNYFSNQFNINLNTTAIDIVDRGYPNTVISDFLTYQTDKKYDLIITNPPFSLAGEFVEKSLGLLNTGGLCAMFLKIQFLEGVKRDTLYKNHPPKYIYVFRNRMATWNNGEPLDSDGKKWATTMCHAWFIWEKNSITEPIVRRL